MNAATELTTNSWPRAFCDFCIEQARTIDLKASKPNDDNLSQFNFAPGFEGRNVIVDDHFTFDSDFARTVFSKRIKKASLRARL